ncbi:hypothetical protein QAD02_022095 [Eretmocerus hayati]|uniref:Uncharacterized protein n=1 Tax=Eretmocerus hayati TaxID=131215 RepID=A0ACC2PS09_9HYME|nr:hypothetical protein QAD02_022095 [Eretmocerus hayati]
MNVVPGYLLGLVVTGHLDAAQVFLGKDNPWWLVLSACALIGPLYALFKVLQWSSRNWSTHPIAESLSVFCNNNTTWLAVAADINIEFRRIDKICFDTNSITKIVATDNWIIKVTPYTLYFAHQSDTALIVNKSDTHALSLHSRGEVQYVNIEVILARSGAKSFNIRLNALGFKDLQDKISRPITILNSVVFHRTLLERFIDTFKEQIAQNPVYETAQELEQCVGCMQAISNVKLNKLCSDGNQTPEACVSCFCRPMWCVDCLAKWFASRQDDTAPETWLSSKCTCPVCRAKFCLLDVYAHPVDHDDDITKNVILRKTQLVIYSSILNFTIITTKEEILGE